MTDSRNVADFSWGRRMPPVWCMRETETAEDQFYGKGPCSGLPV